MAQYASGRHIFMVLNDSCDITGTRQEWPLTWNHLFADFMEGGDDWDDDEFLNTLCKHYIEGDFC